MLENGVPCAASRLRRRNGIQAADHFGHEVHEEQVIRAAEKSDDRAEAFVLQMRLRGGKTEKSTIFFTARLRGSVRSCAFKPTRDKKNKQLLVYCTDGRTENSTSKAQPTSFSNLCCRRALKIGVTSQCYALGTNEASEQASLTFILSAEESHHLRV